MQDVVRRMTNCDRRTELEEVGDFLSRFSQKMRECHGGEGIENNEGVRLNGRNLVYQGWLSIATQ